MFKKTVIIFFLIANYFLLIASPVHAKDFASYYKVTYEFDKNGEAEVNQEISLQNLVSDLYASQYSSSVFGGQVSKIEAYDKIGPLKIQTEQKGQSIIITLSFNEKVVGKDQLLSFILKYHLTGLAKKEGNLWQVAIPKLANFENIDDFDLTIKIPTEYGRLSVINPNPLEEAISDHFFQAKFKKEQITNFGVMATFGQSQIFNYKIDYELKNESSSLALKKIAIPPDTNYQKVFFDSISPEPQDVTVDDDGNFLASFLLQPKQSLKVTVSGKVNIFSQPQSPDSLPVADLTSLKKYTAASQYWPVSEPQIKQLAERLKSPENIYKFVVENLSYDYGSVKSSLTRRGALNSLENPKKSSCSQFADLFVALARAAGIPAREIEGYAYTDNQSIEQSMFEGDLLHAWAEYFDREKGQWLMVDPTWGNTTGGLDFFNKFDMAHFSFVIHGISDCLPVPPGTSQPDEPKERKIFVDLGAGEFPLAKVQLSLESFSPTSLSSIRNQSVEAVFRNKSGQTLYQQTLFLTEPERQWTFSRIPPEATIKINFPLKPEERLKDYFQSFNLVMSNAEVSFKIQVKSLALRASVILGLLLSAVILWLVISLRKC